MDEETLVRKINNVLDIERPVFYSIKLLLNEYQRLRTFGGHQELCLLASLQTELERILLSKHNMINLELKLKIQIALDHVLQKKPRLLTPLEKKIHFVWIGKLGELQIAYMKTWVYYNPDYEIQLWYDSQALLCGVLRQKIKLYAGTLLGIGNNIDAKGTTSTNIKAIIDLQNEFYNNYFLPGKSQGASFDDAVIRFLLTKGWSTLDELNEIKSVHADSFYQAISTLAAIQRRVPGDRSKKAIRLVNINAHLFHNTANKGYYHYYLKELGLRQNAAAASDKARYMILYKEGGIYLDVDLLPSPHPLVWQKLKTTLLEDISKRKAINAHCPPEDAFYVKGVFWTHLTEVLGAIFTNNVPSFDSKAYRRRAYVEMMLMNSLLRACNGDNLPRPSNHQQLALDIYQGSQDPFFRSLQPLFPQIEQIINSGAKESLMLPLGELYVLADGIGYIEHPYVEGGITNSCLLASKNSSAMLEVLTRVLHIDKKIEQHHIDRLHSSNPSSPSSPYHSTLDINLMMYRYDGWIEGSVTTVHSSGPKVIAAWLAEYKKTFVASHPHLAGHFSAFKRQLFVFTQISKNTEENLKSTWIGSAMMSRDHYYGTPSRYQSQLILQFDNAPSTEAAARWLYNKRKEISVWVKITSLGYSDRIVINSPVPQGFQFYDNQTDKRARILLIGQGNNGKLSGHDGEKIAQKIVNILTGDVLKDHIDPRLVLSDQSTDVISCISVLASDIEQMSSLMTEVSHFSLNSGFTYQLLRRLQNVRIRVSEGVSVRDAIVGVDTVGRKWIGRWDVLSEKILWRFSQSTYKWIGVLTPSGNAVEFSKTSLEKGVLTQIRPWIDINKHGRFGLFSSYAFSEGFVPAKMGDPFKEKDLIQFAEQFSRTGGHRILIADVLALVSGMEKRQCAKGVSIRTAIVDDRADQLRILRDILKQVIFNPQSEKWLAWLASSQLVQETTRQKLQNLLTHNPHYYAQLRASVDEDLFDFYYMDFAQKNAYYSIINHLGTESRNIKVIYLGHVEKRCQALVKNIALNRSPLTPQVFDFSPQPLASESASLDNFQENVTKLSDDQTALIYFFRNNNKKVESIDSFYAHFIEIIAEWIPIIPQEKMPSLAGSYFNNVFLFENLTREIALLGHSLSENSIALLQKSTAINGQHKLKVPFLNPKTGVVTEIETDNAIFKKIHYAVEKNYQFPRYDNDHSPFYFSKMLLDSSSWLFNKIFVARFIIEQIKSGKGLFAAPDTEGMASGVGQTLVLQHYVGVAGVVSDLLDDIARFSYFTMGRALNLSAVEFSLRKMAFFSAELLAKTTTSARYAVLANNLLHKDQIKYVLKKFTTGVSKGAMGIGLVLGAADIVLTTQAFLQAPDSDSKIILGTQLGFSVVGFGIQLITIGAALAGAASLVLVLGVLALVVAIIGVLVILMLEHLLQQLQMIKSNLLFFKNLKASWTEGYVLKNDCFIHEGAACITALALAKDCRITFGSQRYQAYGNAVTGNNKNTFKKLNVLKNFNRADTVVSKLPPSGDSHGALKRNLILPCVAQTDYDFSYTGNPIKTIAYESDDRFSAVRELEQQNPGFVFFHHQPPQIIDVGLFVPSAYYEMQEIIPTRRQTNINVVVAKAFPSDFSEEQEQWEENTWVFHFPWIEEREDYRQEYALFKKENVQWQSVGSSYEQFKEKIIEQEKVFRQEIIDNAGEITYCLDNSANQQQILILPPAAFPLKLQLKGGNWFLSALTLGVIAPLSRQHNQLQIGGHKIDLILAADQNIQIQSMIHPQITLIQGIQATEMSMTSWVFDAANSSGNGLKAELDALYQQQIKILPGMDKLSTLLIKNYQEGDYRGNAHYVVNNKILLFTPVLAPFQLANDHAQLLTLTADQAFFYANFELNTEADGALKTDMNPLQPTFWRIHPGLSQLEFVNYAFLPLFSSSMGLNVKIELVEEGNQLTLVERFGKGSSSLVVRYAINLNPAASSPLLLRKIECSDDIFSLLALNKLFLGDQASQTTLQQLRNLLYSFLLNDISSDALPSDAVLAEEIYADEIVQISDHENTDRYWWSKSCGILPPMVLPIEKQARIQPIWSGKTDYQRVSFWRPIDNDTGISPLYIKYNTEPPINYVKLGSVKYIGHTAERFYCEDIQGNHYALDVSGRAYLSTIGCQWLIKNSHHLSAAVADLLLTNEDETNERFHLPVLAVEGFSCIPFAFFANDKKSLQAWYITELKRFYFYYAPVGETLHYLTHDGQGKAAFWHSHNKTLLYINSITLDEVQAFNGAIPENNLPLVEVVLHDIQKAWNNEGIIYLQPLSLLFSVDMRQSPYCFSLQGITEAFTEPYLLSYQLLHALKKEFYAVFNDEDAFYRPAHYANWQTTVPDQPMGVQNLSTLHFSARKKQLWKLLREKILRSLPAEAEIMPNQMWAFLGVSLVNLLPKGRLHVNEIKNNIRGAFTSLKRKSSRNVELKQARRLQFGQYGWYDTQLEALFMIPHEIDPQIHYHYLGASRRNERDSYVSADEQNVYKISALEEWKITQDWPTGAKETASCFIKKFGDELIFIQSALFPSGQRRDDPFSAYFLADIKGIKKLYPRRKSAPLSIQLQNWSAINLIIQAHGRPIDEAIELIIENGALGNYKLQREDGDLWIFQANRKLTLCITKVFDPEPVPEDIVLKTVNNEEQVIKLTLKQLIEKYNQIPDQAEIFYDQRVYPVYVLNDFI